MFTKPIRKVSRVFIHCSASDNPKHDDVSVMREWHLLRGFKDVGYHHFIKKDGTIQFGRSLENTPAAQEGNNTGTIAVCLHGLKKDSFTKEQKSSLIRLTSYINRAYESSITFHGHCEVSNKTCPVLDYKQLLHLDKFGRMPNLTGDKILWSNTLSQYYPF